MSIKHSNQLVVKEVGDEMSENAAKAGNAVKREMEVDATPEEVWEAITTGEGREQWLEHDESQREIDVEVVEEPHRLVWWWRGEEAPSTRVEFLIVAAPAGSRVVVTESVPAFPLEMLARSFTPVRSFALVAA